MHILIIEDESRISSFLVESLSLQGDTVRSLASYAEALEFIEDSPTTPDIVILDRMLGGLDGGELVGPLKRKFSQTSILVLSAITNPEERATLLDKGVDDYMGKPFSLKELEARLRALYRRKSTAAVSKMGISNCEVDLVNHVIRVDGKKMDLSQKEFQIFLTFAQNPGRVYNRFQLLDLIWNTQHEIESNVVEVSLNSLRKKMEMAGVKAKILNKRNMGYWIEA